MDSKQLNDLPKLSQLCCYQNQDQDTDFLPSSSVPFLSFRLKIKYPTKSFSKTGLLYNNWTPFLGSHYNCRVFLFQGRVLLCHIAPPDSYTVHVHGAPPGTSHTIISIHSSVLFIHITDKETGAQRRQKNQLKIPELVSSNWG